MKWWQCAIGALLPLGAEAEPAAASLAFVTQVEVAPRIDGRLDDAAWAAATPLTEFVQSTPIPGAAPSKRTELRLVHDGRTLFVAVRAFDDTPASIAARTLRRDAAALDGDDHLSLVLDPRGTGTNGFFFRVNALGAQRDGLIFDGGTAQPEWDAVWEAAGRIDDAGWTAEFALPLSALAAPADGRAWRFNAQRYVAASGERMSLFGAEADRSVETLADAAPLEGIVPSSASWGLRLRPGLRWVGEQRANGERSHTVQPSLDAFYEAWPGITATLTLNTDFANAELDDRVVNLSRFELFRPEKRAFFTQDAGRFTFGGLNGEDDPSLLPFFSRRIGLGETLDAGLKVSGSAGPVEFGALAVQVARGDLERTPRMGVMRVAGAVGDDGRHRLGMIATQGNPEGIAGSSLAGVDYQYRDTEVLGDKTLEAFAWAQQSRNAGLGTATAQGVQLSYPNYGLWTGLSWQRIGERFLPALGYVREPGVETAEGELGWWQRFDSGDSVLPRVFAGTRRRLDGSERSHYAGPNIEYTTAKGDVFGVEAYAERERIALPFDLLPGVTVPAGDQRWASAAVYANLSTSRAVSGDAYVRSGGYYDGGRLDEQSLSLAWRPSAHWALAGSATRQDVRLPGGRFVAKSATLGLEYTASTHSQQGLVVQRDNVSGLTTLGFRARWEFAPGREVLAALDRVRPLPAGDEVQMQATLTLLWNWER